MTWAGIDYSMTCPAITIGSTSDFKKCKSFAYVSDKKFDGRFGSNIFCIMQLPYESQMERFDNIAQWTLTILKKFKVTNVCLEDYAMAAKGRVFGIAENTGILKHALWSSNIEVITVAPTTAKKFFTGKGNANKILMHEHFEQKTKHSIAKIMNSKAEASPVSDIVDSFAMLQYGLST